jgi:hypothetical protein
MTGMIGELPQHLRCRFNFEKFVNPDGLFRSSLPLLNQKNRDTPGAA